MIVNVCHICNVEFKRPKNPNRVFKYCSTKCMGKDKAKAKRHSEYMSANCVAWNKGMKGMQPWMNISGLNSGEPWNKGLKGVLKAWNKGKKNIHFTGNKNPNWKGGVTKENEIIRKSIEYKEWRRLVFERDSYTCKHCGDNKGGNLQADHIKPFAYFPELRFDVDNGRTLCKECHKKTDTYLNKSRWVNKYA